MRIFRRPVFVIALLLAGGLMGCQMPPGGIPNQATLVWFGQPDANQNLGDLMPNVSNGQVYVYDVTEKKVVAVRTLAPERPAPKIDWEAGHQYKVYYSAPPDSF
jgi:hypothetical protein